MSDADRRYLPWFGVQYQDPGRALTGWTYRQFTNDEDQARELYHALLMDLPGYNWRMVRCGPPEFDYIVRAVILYQEAR